MKTEFGVKVKTVCFLCLLVAIFASCDMGGKLSLDKWTYIQVDNRRDRYDGRTSGDGFWFGLAMGDLTGDGHKDIVSGKWFYRNPGGDMAKKWARVTFPDSMDALLIVDVDGDEFGDVIAAKCNEQYWFEAKDTQGSAWAVKQIGTLPVCNHNTTTQGYNTAQIVPGGKPEILLHGDDIYYLQIPDNPDGGDWPYETIIDGGGNGEWLAAGDLDADGDLDVVGGFYTSDRTSEQNEVSWLENPGNGSGNWAKYVVGISEFRADKSIPVDLNGDGRLDVAVTEERWPGLEPDASLYWFEAPGDPKSRDWQRHTIITQYSMNNLDVADMDQDGDIDLVTCEHKGPGEKLQIWENDGKGNFKENTIDRGKESHLGSRLADMDGDGDMDILSIAWNDFQYLHLWRNDAILGNSSGTKKQMPLGLELTGDFLYQLQLSVNSGEYERYDKPVEIELNFTELLKKQGSTKALDPASIRVVEVSAGGDIIDSMVAFQFDRADSYAPSLASGTLVFMVKGTTAANTTRNFRLLFGEEGGYFIQPVQIKQVDFDDHIEHEGQRSFRTVTPTATHYYHRMGSGFASMEDIDGNDWIGYHPGMREKGQYRGIPNIAPAGFHPGAGENNTRSKILAQGPVKLTIYSETRDKQWACRWEIYPTYARMKLLKKGDKPYWILYEGTPGGGFTTTDYGVNSAGERFALPEHTLDKKWNGDLPAPEWVYFGDADLKRVIYLARHEYSDAIDEYWHFGDGGMTVFGFGRGPREEGWQRLTDLPTNLTIGFAEDSTHAGVTRVVNSAYQDIEVAIGGVEKYNQ